MKIGFSLSPGGLLLPYHLGALAALSHHNYITESTPLAGSSAGAIAVSSHASGVPPLVALEAASRVSSKSTPLFVARGGLIHSLKRELDHLLDPEAHTIINEREGITALAHRELFPRNRSVLQTHFDTRQSLMDAVCDSSMFPFFLTNAPVRMVRRTGRLLPRMVVDGVFGCSMERCGCPDFDHCEERPVRGARDISSCLPTKSKYKVDRTIMVSVFPIEMLSLTTSPKTDQIGPAAEENMVIQAARLIRMATQASSSTDLYDLYQQGHLDAENWIHDEERRARLRKQAERRQELKNEN